MANFTCTANTLKYASGSSWTSGKARQGVYEKLTAKIGTLQHDKTDKESRAKKASLFIGLLSEQQECIDFDPALFTVYVERVVVSGTKKNIGLTFVLMDGSEYMVEGVR